MKKIISPLFLICLMLMSAIPCLSQSNKKTDKARKNVSKAQENLKDARNDLQAACLDSTKDYIEFKKEAKKQIAENNEQIFILPKKKWNGEIKNEEKYQQEVNELQAKNVRLQEKIDLAHNTSTTIWEDFKKEFNYDMSELRKAIQTIGTNDVKN